MLFERVLKRLAVLVAAASLTVIAYGQDLEEIGVKKGVKLNGSINLNTIGYYADGIDQRRDPFNWFLTGSLNVDLFGYSAPLSFSYSNTNKSFSQPFNQFSFAPSYKWVKAYIGYNAMNFSNYTLAGHIFLGGGLELSPGNWRISTMYGRLKKEVPFQLEDSLQYTNASYKRMGYGLKVGYDHNGDLISANVFTAKDDVNSIPFVLPESQLAPQQNVAVSANIRKRFLGKFFIEAEYAISALNTDTRANHHTEDTVSLRPSYNLVQGLLPENSTNRYFDALNASVGYQGSWYGLQIRYERVAPEYQTLGAYYFNNDLQNISFAPSVRLLQNKLTFAGNLGLQENNLDESLASTTERVVGAINANYMPDEFWNIALSYSNFSSYTNVRPLPDPFLQDNMDTLNFYQVSQTMNATILRSFGQQQSPQSVMLSSSYQRASDKASYEGGSQQSDFITTNASYSYSLVPANATFALAGNIYMNNAAGMKSLYWGPSLNVSKSFREKTFKVGLSSSYNETSGDNIKTSPVLNNRVSLNYSPLSENTESKISHNFSLGLNLLNRLQSTGQQPAFTELTGTFNYSFTF